MARFFAKISILLIFLTRTRQNITSAMIGPVKFYMARMKTQ